MNNSIYLQSPFLSSAARTTSGQQEIPFANDNGNVTVCVNVTAAGGTTPTLNLSLEESADGTTWFPVVAGAQLTAAGQQRLAIVPGTHGATHRRIRLRWVIAGTSPTFTFTAIAVSRPGI